MLSSRQKFDFSRVAPSCWVGSYILRSERQLQIGQRAISATLCFSVASVVKSVLLVGETLNACFAFRGEALRPDPSGFLDWVAKSSGVVIINEVEMPP